MSLFLSTIVRGPGQNSSARIRAVFGISFTILFISSNSLICRIRGLSEGLPFASYIFGTAFSSRPLAPRPYTVSVGKATRPPFFMIPAAFFIPSFMSYSSLRSTYSVFISLPRVCRLYVYLLSFNLRILHSMKNFLAIFCRDFYKGVLFIHLDFSYELA